MNLYANLDDYAGDQVTLVFDFFATSVVNDEGWEIDDVAIDYCDGSSSSFFPLLYIPILSGAVSRSHNND